MDHIRLLNFLNPTLFFLHGRCFLIHNGDKWIFTSFYSFPFHPLLCVSLSSFLLFFTSSSLPSFSLYFYLSYCFPLSNNRVNWWIESKHTFRKLKITLILPNKILKRRYDIKAKLEGWVTAIKILFFWFSTLEEGFGI